MSYLRAEPLGVELVVNDGAAVLLLSMQQRQILTFSAGGRCMQAVCKHLH